MLLDTLVGEALAYVQPSRVKVKATLHRTGFLTPRSPVRGVIMTLSAIQSALDFATRQIHANETYLLRKDLAPQSRQSIEHVMEHWLTIKQVLQQALEEKLD